MCVINGTPLSRKRGGGGGGKQKEEKDKNLVSGNFVIHQQQAKSCLLSLHFGEVVFFMGNAWPHPKIFISFTPYQTRPTSIFSYIFSIYPISSPTKHTLKL